MAAARNFCNKLWNASKFVMMNLEAEGERGRRGEWENSELRTQNSELTAPDRWILSRLNRTITEVNARLASYDMDDAMRAIYAFFWDDFCDWYIEGAKSRLREEGEDKQTVQAVLHTVLETILRLMHPMMPFITEEIWQAMSGYRVSGLGSDNAQHSTPNTQHPSIIFAQYPQAAQSQFDPLAEERMELVMESVRALRNLRAELGLPPAQRLTGAVVPASRKVAETLSTNSGLIAELGRLTELLLADQPPSGEGQWAGTPIEGAEVFLNIGEALDIPKELERIAKDLAAIEADLEKSNAKLAGAKFVERAPAAIVEKERTFNESLIEKQNKLIGRRRMLSG